MNLPYMLWLDSNYSLNFCTLKEIFILLSQKKAQKDCEIRRKLVVANSVYQNALRKKGLESQSNVCRGGVSPLRTANIKAESLVNKKFTRLSAFSGSAGKCSSEHVACGLFGVLFTAPKKYTGPSVMRDMQSIVRKHGDTAVRSYDRAAASATAHSFLRNRRFRPRCRQAAPFLLTTGTPERKIRWFHIVIGRHIWRKNRNPFHSFLI